MLLRLSISCQVIQGDIAFDKWVEGWYYDVGRYSSSGSRQEQN